MAKAKKNETATASTGEKTELQSRPVKNRAEGLAIKASLSVNPNKLRLTEKFRGRSTPVADADVIALADSIRTDGQQQPVQVRAVDGTDEYEVIFGNTRTRACQMIANGYKNTDERDVEPKADFLIRCEVVECSDEEAFKRNIRENNDRLNCSPIDNMKNHERLRSEFGMSDAAIARFYGFSHSATVNQLKKLQNLADEYQTMIHVGDMTFTGGLKLAEFNEQEQTKIMALATGDSDENGVKFGAAQISDAIKKFKQAQKDAAAQPTTTGDGITTADTTPADGTPDNSGNVGGRSANNETEKTYSLTQKQFKDALKTMAGYEEKNEAGEVVKRCPDKVAECCNVILSFVEGKTNIQDFAKWMADNVKG